ncbi:hypothetical protein [Yersinia aleksiciae]|uniref:Alpha-related fimbriae major subunit n=1 Tax=Yersinia aleksiciae TaxID=263819 RepID=A0A0T9UM64_YERAE|nr:hypothetical protein [Yersinia aleksiciae]CNL52689.1 alpha-related fimbriae major subunit [Yersinia aleksiciae]
MNIKNKYFFMGTLLLILSPTVMAAPYFYNDYVKNYSNCSVKLLDDNSVEVSFQANLADNLFNLQNAGRHLGRWKELIKLRKSVPMPALNRHNALLSLYFYHADGSPDLNIQLSHISNLTLNGAFPRNSNNNIQEIRFNSGSAPFNRTHYSVSFKVAANALKSIRIGATVGGVLIGHSTKQEYPLLSSKGVSFSPSGNGCEFFDPQSGITPPALKVDPKFQLISGAWQLKPVDLDHLLDHIVVDPPTPLHIQLVNPRASRFCISYRSLGVENNSYMIKATNLNGRSTNSQYFQLREKAGNNSINYKVRMKNTENADTDFELPKDQKFIKFKNSNNDTEQMCWSPKIRLYGTDTTIDKGSYSDTLNFTITPEA